MYNVVISKPAIKDLERLDYFTKRIIIEWLEKHLKDTADPRQFGKPLSASRKGQWRYRVGDYRIIAKIEDDKLIILVIAIGHRIDIYLG